MAATQSLAISSSHSDLITSLLFSPQSTHLATCSLDSQIRIVQRNTSTGLYDQNQVIFKAHDGPVLSLSWSKPQFGLILASGGVDGTIKIWRQPDQSQLLSHHHNHNKSRHGSTRHSNQNWILCTTFTEPRGTIRSLEFSPSEFGLKLASISSDSRLRVWECIDPIKVNDFNLVQEIDLNLLPLSFPSSSSSSTMMTGGGGTNYSTSTSGGNSSGVSVVNSNGNTSNENASTNGSVTGSSSIDGSRRIGVSQSTVESDGGWSLSWCREHWWGETLAVSSGSNGLIRLFHFPSSNSSSSSLSSTTGSNSINNSNNSWINFLNLYPTRQTLSSSSITSPTDSSSIPPPPPVPNHLPPTSSLNWAPPSGRSFQLLAAGSKDSKVRVYKIFPPSLQSPGSSSSSSSSNYHHQHHDQGGGGGEWTAQLDVELDESIHYNNNNNNSSSSGIGGGVNNPPGGGGGTSPSSNINNIANGIGSTKVEWNVTGTVLSTSGGEDGKVRLWKSTYTGQWRQITSLNTEVSPLSVVEGTMDH